MDSMRPQGVVLRGAGVGVLAVGLVLLAFAAGCGLGGDGDNLLVDPVGVQVTSISPSRFYVSDEPIPFVVDGTWENARRDEIRVHFRAVSGQPFRSVDGKHLDTLELAGVMNDLGQVEGSIPARAVAEAATSWVEVHFGAGEPGISSSPLGVFNFQFEIPAPAHIGSHNFGESVAVSGDTLVVGAWRDATTRVQHGTAYVYVRAAAGWAFQQRLGPSDGGAQDKFGWAVDVSGDTAVVGAFYTDGAVENGGAAYVFVRNGTTWTEQAKLIPPDGQPLHEFAISVAIDGDTIAVGTSGDSDVDTAAGSVYVFVRSGSAWTLQQELHASSAGFAEWLGHSVEIEGDTILASAPHADTMGLHGGSAFVFTRSGTVWTEQQELTSSDGGAGDALGWSIGLSGNLIVLGSSRWPTPAGAYVFVLSGGTWVEAQIVGPPPGWSGDSFGREVVLEGGRLVVGVRTNDDKGDNAGAAYVFERGAAGWLHQQTVYAADAAEGDAFGRIMAMNGGTLVVVGYSHEHPVLLESGSVYVH